MELVGKHFANASKLIQISDKESGLILNKGGFSYDAPGYMISGTEKRKLNFMLKLSFKDGKYKMEMSDFNDEVLDLVTYDDNFEENIATKKNVQKQWKAAQQETQFNIVPVQKSIKDFIEQNVNWQTN